MWTCNFKIYEEKSQFREIIVKNKIDMYYYPINNYVQKDRYFFVFVAIIKGDKKDKNNFFKDLNKLKKTGKWRKIELLEIEEDFFTMITSHTVDEESKREVNIFYNREIIHYKPVIFHKDGWEEWEIASLKRKPIEDFIITGEKFYNLKLLKFHKKKIKNFGFLTILPELTEKQENALKLALEQGYYNYPRKISLDKLSKIAKLSFSTFQAHVKKAENKIISYVINLKR